MHDLLPRVVFDDQALDIAPELLTLDRARLLDMLHCLAALRTLPELRRRTAELRAQLGGPAGALQGAEGSGDTVTCTRDYLEAELDQIAAAYTLDRAAYYISRLIKGITEVRTGAINDINLNRWKEYEDIYTDSLWLVNRRDGSGAHTADYWGNFIPQIPNQMMRRYTRPGDWVIDPFAGSGTTLIEARRLGRNCLGLELQPSVAARARALIDSEPNRHAVAAEIATADCLAADYPALLRQYGRESAQLVIVHPPYFDIIKFSDDPRDLSNAASIAAFLAMFGTLIDRVAPVLDAGRYLALVIGDKYAGGEWIPLGFQAMNEVLKRDFTLKSIVVKNFEQTAGKRNQQELWKYRALVGGFYVFKHEYIFVFRKR
ncbi:MAG: site-specific DNA-methyltransferase [Kouleothrix sp.]|jgi:hypothetical protein|nr:site-specific DNA-methyltransferase [Kouleothrix sp.]